LQLTTVRSNLVAEEVETTPYMSNMINTKQTTDILEVKCSTLQGGSKIGWRRGSTSGTRRHRRGDNRVENEG